MAHAAKKSTIADPDFKFPVDLSKYEKIGINPWADEKLSDEVKAKLVRNIEIFRDALVFFTACGSASGYGGHTGGAFDTAPEVVILDAMFRGCPDKFVPIFFDEAGHRVATQYLLSALNGHITPESLMNYRRGHANLPGHPELGATPGVTFSSGRLGHMWPQVNGVAMAHPDRVTICLGSDGSQMEGNDAEAARLAAARDLNIKLFVDDNDVTILGHPSDYLTGYDLEKTLLGHGIPTSAVKGEDFDALYAAMRNAVITTGPSAVIARRHMCPGIEHVEGQCNGHDAIAVAKAIPYLEAKGYPEAGAFLKTITKSKDPYEYEGVGPVASMRSQVGASICNVLGRMSLEERTAKYMVIDSDLGGSTGLNAVMKQYPECFVQSGVMERGNFAAAAGWGSQAGPGGPGGPGGEPGKIGIFSTFAAFLEMCCSEITMARLNFSNVFCHFSHSGVDDMADNTCHYGLNIFFADNGLEDQHPTNLYFPCTAVQADAITEAVLPTVGLNFLFTTRSKLPMINDAEGKPMFGEDYKYTPGKDELLRDGKAGFVVAFGDAVYRAVDAVDKLKKEGIDVGLVNKSHLNVVDEEMMAKIGASGFVLVVEPINKNTGLGIRFGTWLLERGLCPKYAHIGTHQEGCGGLWEHAPHQGYDPVSVIAKVKSLVA